MAERLPRTRAATPGGSLSRTAVRAAVSPHGRPWLAVAAEVPVTVGTHAAWGASPAAAVGLTLAAGALTAATWWAGQSTTAPRRLHATATTGAATGYLVVGTVADPLSVGLLSALAIGGSALAASWNVRKVLRVDPDTKNTTKSGESQTGVLVKALGEARAKLRKAPEVEPNKVAADLQLAPGQMTTDDLAARTRQIASELGVAPTAIRVLPDPDRGDRATLVVVPQDMLRDGATYPGPSAPGGSITDPLVIGIYEDGAPAVMWLPADETAGRNATHVLVAGMNGSGKSAGMTVAITEALTRRDVVVWAVDPSKGQQTFGPLLPYLDWAEMSMDGGEAMLDALPRVITARADALGRAGYKNWTPEAFRELGMPYMVVWLEEAAKLFREGMELESLVMEARSAGISVVISLQRPSATTMPTDVREQLGAALCFGVKGSTTADMALPDDVRDMGAAPEAWQNRRPGYAYLVAPGVDDDRYATPMRTYRISDDDVTGVLAVAPRPALDPVSAAAAGAAYAQRTRHATAADHDHDQEETVPATPAAAAEESTDAMERAVARTMREADDPDLRDIPDPDVDPDAEIPPPPGMWAFGTPAPAPAATDQSPEEALAELLAVLDELRADGVQIVGPRHIKAHLAVPGGSGRIARSRPWLSQVLSSLADDGVHLADTSRPGEYRLLHPELTPA
ncbi:plasmid transfer protein TraB [Streptomyces fradiae]|uniref:plasmid transfer protein TraB n=1 Tax=Streptomyces fradiae TaxID=1906 RepID=UPI003985D165